MDTFEAVEIRPFATDADFSLAQDNTYDSTSEGERADVGLPVTTDTTVPPGTGPTNETAPTSGG